MTLYNFMTEVKDDQEVIDFMYRLLAGLIYALVNTPRLALNFYPILGELGTVSDRLGKICGWSKSLFATIKDGAKPMQQSWNNPDEIIDWLNTIQDKKIGGYLRLFIQPYVAVPHSVFDPNLLQEER